MKFTTITGSLYEVNTDSKQIRRLNGAKDPSPRQGKDGEWRSYLAIYPNPVKVGTGVIIRWGNDTPLLPGTEPGSAVPTTMTSTVVAVEP